ncbi:hypothetical protein E2C01_012615 [Portunus trituberculatus]|uniref:Uncharacterized protein n=1 Tax=Portunus trituberculatus TaxID=210409 RepID=A0A5B7DEH1_PORTR|nr:hypothetical protein [Portunus trituberculatus]
MSLTEPISRSPQHTDGDGASASLCLCGARCGEGATQFKSNQSPVSYLLMVWSRNGNIAACLLLSTSSYSSTFILRFTPWNPAPAAAAVPLCSWSSSSLLVISSSLRKTHTLNVILCKEDENRDGWLDLMENGKEVFIFIPFPSKGDGNVNRNKFILPIFLDKQ